LHLFKGTGLIIKLVEWLVLIYKNKAKLYKKPYNFSNINLKQLVFYPKESILRILTNSVLTNKLVKNNTIH